MLGSGSEPRLAQLCGAAEGTRQCPHVSSIIFCHYKNF